MNLPPEVRPAAWRRWFRGVAVALVASALLPDAAGFAGTFGRGGFRGTPHETPTYGRGAREGVHPFFQGERPAEPDIFVTPEERLQRLPEPPSLAGGTSEDATPWPDAPHLRVRRSGDPRADAARIAQLEQQLGRALDPSKIRVASLVDDAGTDHVLDSSLPSWARAAGRLFETTLRSTPDRLDEDRLAAALDAHRGGVLLLVAHIDAQREAIVFQDAHGNERSVSLDELNRAEVRAGVEVVLVGCRSALFRAAGFVDDLNSLDAAAAVARVIEGKPASRRDFFRHLSGPEVEMRLDPEDFQARGEATIVRPGSDEPLSTVRWRGASRTPAVTAYGTPLVGTATALWTALATHDPAIQKARAALAGVTLLSWLAGILAGWRRRPGGMARAGAALGSAIWHGAALTAFASTFAEASTDETVAGVAWFVMFITDCGALVASAGAFDEKYDWHAVHTLQVVRAILLGVPFFLVYLLFDHGPSALPGSVRAALFSLYRAVQGAPSLGLGLSLALLAIFAHVLVAQTLRDLSRRQRFLAQARAELASAGVTRPANVASALRGVRSLLLAVHRVGGGDLSQFEVKPLVEAVAPDPWIDGLPRRFALVKVACAGDEVLGLARPGSSFVHPVPEVLAQQWRQGQVGAGTVPRLLALIEPRVRSAHFLAGPRKTARRIVRFALPMLAMGATIGVASVSAIELWLPGHLRGSIVAWAAGTAIGGALLVGSMLAWQLRCLLYDWWLAHVIENLSRTEAAVARTTD